MIFDNSKLAIIFVILFLIIITSAFLILRTRFSGQTVTPSDVVTNVTPSVAETPRVITPQVINPSPTGEAQVIAPVVTISPTAAPTLTPNPPLAPSTGIGSALPNTSYPAVGIAVLAGVVAFIGFRIRKFPE